MGSSHNDKAFLDYYKVHMAEFCEMLRGPSRFLSGRTIATVDRVGVEID